MLYFQAYSSDLSRALETCTIILSHNLTPAKGLKVETTPLLREISFGKWEGKPYQQYRDARSKIKDELEATGMDPNEATERSSDVSNKDGFWYD